MKTLIHKLWVLTTILCASLSASAYDFKIGGIYYEITSFVDLTCKVTRGDNKYKGEIIIPSEIIYNGLKLSVTAIGDQAFSGCVVSVSIPNSVTYIGESAFCSCNYMSSIKIPNSVTYIDNEAFHSCCSLKEINIPNSVTYIGSSAFRECSSLKDINIPNSVTYIGSDAFRECRSLQSINIPNSVTYIGYRAFYDCSSLTSVYYATKEPVSGNSNIFIDEAYQNATLYMPEEGIALASAMDPWKNFKNIKAYDFTGIEGIAAEINADNPCEVFNLSGVKVGETLEDLASGLYIVRQGNEVKKIAIK